MGLDNVVLRHTISTGISMLMVSQLTPGFWGITAWYQSIGIRIPRLDRMGLDHCIHCAFRVLL